MRWLRENYDFKGESKQFLFQSFKQRTQHVHFILHFPQYLKKKVSNHILVRFRFHIVSLHSCPDPSCNISSVQNFIIKEDGRKMADSKALSFHFFSQKLLFKIRNWNNFVRILENGKILQQKTKGPTRKIIFKIEGKLYGICTHPHDNSFPA